MIRALAVTADALAGATPDESIDWPARDAAWSAWSALNMHRPTEERWAAYCRCMMGLPPEES